VNDRQLKNIVHLLNKEVDLYHLHNEPNWIFRTVRDNTDKPVVFDIHDWTSIRKDPVAWEVENEKYALANADAFVVPSRGYLKKIREVSKKPSLLVYSKVPSFLFAKEPVVRKHGLVYEGGLKGKDQNQTYNYEYRNWAQFIQKVVAGFPNGNKAYLYSANDGDDFSEYKSDKIELKMPMLYNELIQEMAQYDCGLVGTPFPLPDFEDSMPNKLFEYIGAGIPCVVVNSPEAARFVEENGLGLSVQDASEVPQALEKLKDNTVRRDRWRHTMETEMPPLIEMYGELCGKKERVISQM
jgi:glycosyltransferase involved in cell wall biosynthesis